MSNFTQEKITDSIHSLTNLYESIKSDSSQFNACIVIYQAICALEVALNYEPKPEALELPFKIEPIKQPEYV